jgi:ribonucleoside-diphosphate reductase alpha chain
MEIIKKEVANQEIASFSQSIQFGVNVGLISPEVGEFVKKNARKLNAAINTENDRRYEYFGLKTVFDRYLLKHPTTRKVFETPQFWLMRVAAGIFTGDVKGTIDYYNMLSSHEYLTSTPTLFNSATNHTQMSSCYLLPPPSDDVEGIYKSLADVAKLSKWAGGIGVDYSLPRGEGSLIKGTNGLSNGIIPFLHTLDASVLAINQGGKRKGAACVYLETFHSDLIDFLSLRDNTGDPHRRTHNLNTANWIPDIFMRRVESGGDWTLFSTVDPEVAALIQLYGPEYDVAYESLEQKYEAMQNKPKWYKKMSAQTIWHRMMKTLCETGNGWVGFKDRSNELCNQVTKTNGKIVRSSNLCTEIIEVVDQDNIAVCNLGSIVLDAFVDSNKNILWDKLAVVVRLAVTGLNKVIDKNFYPVEEAKNSNLQWRPIGLGVMATQDLLHKLDLCFDDPEAEQVIEDIHAFIYYHALDTSIDLAKVEGKFPNYNISKFAEGKLHFDLDGLGAPATPNGIDWQVIRDKMNKYGARNSLLVAIAPTATIASIVGKGECTEPSHSNLFSRQTLSGEFVQINTSLVNDLKQIGLWNESIKTQLLSNEGSVQNIDAIPAALKRKYRIVWEYSMKAIINLAAKRGRYIDQSQSLNLYMENPTIGKASSMYFYGWKKGLKTTYYLRSRGATRVQKLVDSTTPSVQDVPKMEYSIDEVIQCSLDNPETCEACQ